MISRTDPVIQKSDFPNWRMLNSLSFAQTPKTAQKHSAAQGSSTNEAAEPSAWPPVKRLRGQFVPM